MGSKKIKNKNQKFLIKNIPYYSQRLDSWVIDRNGKIYKNIIDGYWFKNACGIASLKMVMDYYRNLIPNYKKLPIMELVWRGIEKGAFSVSAGGWYHQGLIEIAKEYGFRGKRFDWNVKRGKKLNEIKKEKALKEITKIIKSGKPLIVSIYKNFIPNNSGHLIVLVGFKNNIFGELKGFYFNDPDSYDRKSKKYAFVNKNKFLNGWKARAILIWPKKIKK